MNDKTKKLYSDKVKEIMRKSEMLEGCMNRMCVTDDSDELLRLHSFLVLYASDLYRLNRNRLYIEEYGDKESPSIDQKINFVHTFGHFSINYFYIERACYV